MARALIESIDRTYPEAKYSFVYLRQAVPAEALFMAALRLLVIHRVGLILADERPSSLRQPQVSEQISQLRAGTERAGATASDWAPFMAIADTDTAFARSGL